MGSIWRDPEIHRAALSYVHTGHVPGDAFWRSLSDRRNLNPARFDDNHPNIAGFFAPPAVLGRLPNIPMVRDFRHRFEIAPIRFEHYHRFWGRLIRNEPTITVLPPVVPGVPNVPILPPPVHGQGVPEPSSVVLLCVGLVVTWFYRRLK